MLVFKMKKTKIVIEGLIFSVLIIALGIVIFNNIIDALSTIKNEPLFLGQLIIAIIISAAYNFISLSLGKNSLWK